MNCTHHGSQLADLICAIQHPAVELTDWLVPLASSLLGAAIGALALILIYRSESRARAEETRVRHAERFEGALAELMRQMYALAAGYRDWDKDQLARRGLPLSSLLSMPGESPARAMERPTTDAVLGAHEIAQMIANPGERKVLDALSGCIVFSATLPANDAQGNLTAAAGLVRIWRNGLIDGSKAARDLDAMEREAIERLTSQSAVDAASAVEDN
jgi:hypothetical protein